MKIKLTGQWKKAQKILDKGAQRVELSKRKIMASEAKFYAQKIKEGLESQAPGKKPIKPPAESTLISREFKGFNSTKSLIVRRDLVNSITDIVKGDKAFAGIPKSARGTDGQNLAKIGEINEKGKNGIVIEITPKMRKLFGAMFAGSDNESPGKKKVIIVNIPARPFITPVLETYGKASVAIPRIAKKFSFFTAFMFGK